MKTTAPVSVRPATKRHFSLIRVDSVDIVTSRGRGARQFKQNVRSIEDNGLLKPILVNSRDHARTGRYALICGEGRLKAHQELKRDHIKAEIVNVDEATAWLMTLGENMTKCQPQVIEFARALREMHHQGATIADLERVTGFGATHVRGYLRLIEQGEERLIKGVEQGSFTLEFAMKVAESPEAGVQQALMNAFDKKVITARHVETVRKVLAQRMRLGASLKPSQSKSAQHADVSVEELERDIGRLTRERQQFVNEAQSRETRLIILVEALRRIRSAPACLSLLRRHALDTLPALQGKYGL